MNSYIWLLIAFVAFAAEVATPSALISVWFSIGALFGALMSFLGFNLSVQVLSFIIMSGLTFAFLRPLLMKVFKVTQSPTNADRLIGYKGRLSEAISEEKWGALFIHGLRYSVSSIDSKGIEKDQWVRVVALKGARLVVEEMTQGE